MFQDRLSHLFAEHLHPDVRAQFIAEFNRRDSRYRTVMARTVLPQFRDISTDDLSEGTVEFLLQELRDGSYSSSEFNGDLLGNTATEEFVAERLLPLLLELENESLLVLKRVLNSAGLRHGRRYIARQ
jgi:hypothetical protein